MNGKEPISYPFLVIEDLSKSRLSIDDEKPFGLEPLHVNLSVELR